jgi:hypothetical protein
MTEMSAILPISMGEKNVGKGGYLIWLYRPECKDRNNNQLFISVSAFNFAKL